MKHGTIWALALLVLGASAVFAASQKEGASAMPAEKDWVEVSIAQWDLEYGDDAVAQKIAEDMKIRIKSVAMGWDTTDNILLWAASDSLPDLTATYTVEQDINRFYSWIDQGLLRSIPQDLVNKYPRTRKLFDNATVLQAVKKIRGGLYWIPRLGSVNNAYVASQQAIYYRTDWAQKVGVTKMPATLDEMYDLARAFTVRDPDGNGKDDTYGFSWAAGSGVYYMFGFDPDGWILEDGRYVPAIVSRKAKDALTFLQRLYRDGYLDPEFAINGWRQALQKFSQHKVGMVLRNADLYWIDRTIRRIFGEANPNLRPLDVVGVLAPFVIDGKPRWPQLNETCGTEVSSKLDDARLDRVLGLYEYLTDPMVKRMTMFGFEGVDYEIKDGNPVPFVDPATGENISIPQKYPASGIGMFTDWGWDHDIAVPGNPDIPLEMKQFGAVVRERHNAAAVADNLALRFIPSPAKDTLTIFGEYSPAFDQLIISDEDVSVSFARFVKEQMDKGMAQAITEVNAKAKQLGL